MRMPYFADPENLKVPDEPTNEAVPDNITMPELVDGVIRGKYKLDPSQGGCW
jgi:hypothetical protein